MLATSMETPAMQRAGPSPAVSTPYEQEVVLLTTVDIAPGYSQVIKMRRTDSAYSVAQEFCRAHGLPEAVVGALEDHLQSHLDKAQESSPSFRTPNADLSSQEQAAPTRHASKTSNKSKAKPKKKSTQGDQTTVFDRLYQLARERAEADQTQEATIAPTRHKATQSSHNQTAPHLRGEYANYGEFLYIEGLANMEHRRQKAQHVTQEQQEQELFGATFQPEILEKSRSMRAHVHVPVWQRLGRHSCTTSAAKRRAIYQADRERENLTECTFKPKINDRSSDMMSQRQEVLKQLHITPYEKLYQDAEVRRKKMEQKESAEEHVITSAPPARRPGSARPLSRSLGHIPSESSFDLRSMCSLPASDRLHAYHLRKEAKLSRAREAPLRDTDGTPLFTPRTGRAPVADARTAAGVPVWEMLYSRRHEARDRRHQLERQQEEESRRSRMAPRVNKRSEILLHSLQQRRFQQIFEFLDQQQRGALDLLETVLGESPEFWALSSEIRADLEAAALLLCVELGLCGGLEERGGWEEGGQRARLMHAHTVLAERCTLGEPVEALVGEEEFMEVMARVVEAVPRVPPRTYLLPDLRMNSGEADLTFQPVINGKSVEMALQRWPDRAGPVHEHLHDHAKTVQSHRQTKQRAREVEELSKCTFQPELVSTQSHSRHRTVHMAGCAPGSPSLHTRSEMNYGEPDITAGSTCSQSLMDIANGVEHFDLSDAQEHCDAEGPAQGPDAQIN